MPKMSIRPSASVLAALVLLVILSVICYSTSLSTAKRLEESRLAANTGFIRGICTGKTIETCNMQIHVQGVHGEALEYRLVHGQPFVMNPAKRTYVPSLLPSACTGTPLAHDSSDDCAVTITAPNIVVRPPPESFV